MIKSIRLKNFQAHKDLTLELGRFTTLTGGSNGGKSAVLRAFYGLVRNDAATDYIRHGQKHFEVTVTFSDGYIVTWRKGRGVNAYDLTRPDGSMQTFDKVGSKVPDEVAEVLRLGPVAVKGSDKEFINFHNQLEPPFLVSATPPNVAKLFGELTSAAQLYTAVGEGNRSVRSTNALKSTRKGDLEDIEDRLKPYETLEDQERLLHLAQKTFNEAKDAQETVTALEEEAKQLEEVEAKIVVAETELEAWRPVASFALDELVSVGEGLETLERNLSDVHRFDEAKAKLEKLLEYLTTAASVDFDGALEAAEQAEGLMNVLGGVQESDSSINAVQTNLDKAAAAVDLLAERIAELTSRLSECPECGAELSDEAKEQLLVGTAHGEH